MLWLKRTVTLKKTKYCVLGFNSKIPIEEECRIKALVLTDKVGAVSGKLINRALKSHHKSILVDVLQYKFQKQKTSMLLDQHDQLPSRLYTFKVFLICQ